ncbi:unnamed protein product [Thlaspi arvense]|uniref:Uncharacterized protein n=1 Tax=Thlaspi arvense TaxID=13288 RepID=A0AAU9SNW1_THLAR|nr:unnamed protein product [Thlaspi arvense]
MNFLNLEESGSSGILLPRLACVHLGRPQEALNLSFKFSNFIAKHQDFLPRINAAWEQLQFDGTKMLCLIKKLKMIKWTIKDINRDHFSNLEKRVSDTLHKLSTCQNNFLSSPTPALASLEREAHRIWSDLALAEERFLQQRSRVTWIECDDKNTVFPSLYGGQKINEPDSLSD